jgi:hypothetical protein
MSIVVSELTFSGSAGALSKQQVIQGDGKGQMKPKEIVLACADAGAPVQGITWKRWNIIRATGTGTRASPKRVPQESCRRTEPKLHLVGWHRLREKQTSSAK